MSPSQFGSTAGRSTEDAICALQGMTSGRPEKYAITVFIDIVGAFDGAWWTAILGRLQEWDVSSNAFELVSSFLYERVAEIGVGGDRRCAEIELGCPQGSVLAPILWKPLFDGLLKKLVVLGYIPIAYVDDLASTAYGRSRREVLQRAHDMVDNVLHWCLSNKMAVSEEKTKAAVTKGVFARRHPPRLRLGDRFLEFPDEIVYLGITFSPKLGVALHITNLSAKVVRVNAILARLSSATWGLPFKFTSQIYKACKVGAVLYAAGAWVGLYTLDRRKDLSDCSERP